MAQRQLGSVLVIGSVNLDFIIKSDIPLPGQTVLGESYSKRAGGKGANQAVAASRISKNVCLVGCIGVDTEGELLKESLQKNKVDTKFLFKNQEFTNSGTAFVVVDTKGENSISVIPASNYGLTIENIDTAIKEVHPEVLLLQAEINLDVLKEVLKKYSRKIRIIFNLAPYFNVSKELITECDPLIVNELEAKDLLGIEIKENYQEITDAFSKICKSAIVTLGSQGVLICEESRYEKIPALPIEHVIDSTGAGDAFVGSCAAYIASGLPIKEASRKATKFAGISVSRPGGFDSYPEIEEI